MRDTRYFDNYINPDALKWPVGHVFYLTEIYSCPEHIARALAEQRAFTPPESIGTLCRRLTAPILPDGNNYYAIQHEQAQPDYEI